MGLNRRVPSIAEAYVSSRLLHWRFRRSFTVKNVACERKLPSQSQARYIFTPILLSDIPVGARARREGLSTEQVRGQLGME